MNLTTSAIEYIKINTPEKGSGRFDTIEWKEYTSLPSLPYVIKILNGLCHNHTKTQVS